MLAAKAAITTIILATFSSLSKPRVNTSGTETILRNITCSKTINFASRIRKIFKHHRLAPGKYPLDLMPIHNQPHSSLEKFGHVSWAQEDKDFRQEVFSKLSKEECIKVLQCSKMQRAARSR